LSPNGDIFPRPGEVFQRESRGGGGLPFYPKQFEQGVYPAARASS